MSPTARPSVTVRVAVHADAAAIAQVQTASFNAALHNQRLRPLAAQDPAGFLAWQKTRNESIMAGGEGAMVWLVAQLPDSHDIAAVARWERIDDACASALEPVTAVPFGGPEQIRFFDELGPMHRRIMGSRPHYCVHILATVPECQGRGAASALLRHISHMADTEGRPLYLEAAPGSLPVYLKHGFREVGETLRLPAGTTSVTDSVVTAMVREPVSA